MFIEIATITRPARVADAPTSAMKKSCQCSMRAGSRSTRDAGLLGICHVHAWWAVVEERPRSCKSFYNFPGVCKRNYAASFVGTAPGLLRGAPGRVRWYSDFFMTLFVSEGANALKRESLVLRAFPSHLQSSWPRCNSFLGSGAKFEDANGQAAGIPAR